MFETTDAASDPLGPAAWQAARPASDQVSNVHASLNASTGRINCAMNVRSALGHRSKRGPKTYAQCVRIVFSRSWAHRRGIRKSYTYALSARQRHAPTPATARDPAFRARVPK